MGPSVRRSLSHRDIRVLQSGHIVEDPQSAGLADPWAESVSVIGQSGTPHGGGCGRGPRSVLAATNGKSVLRLQEGKNFPLTSKIFNHFSTMRKNSFKVVRDTPEKMGMTQEQWDSPEEAEKRHNRWNTRRAIRMFQKSKAAAAGMTWEDWQAHKAAIREAKEKTPHAAYLSAYRRTPRGYAIMKACQDRQREKNRLALAEAKSKPCLDCGGYFHPEAMDFDHREGEEKSFCISYTGKRIGKGRLLSELAKCDLVCANCHRVRTARRRAGLPPIQHPPEYEI